MNDRTPGAQSSGSLLRSGLVSVTFRSLSPVQIAELAAEQKLAAIEWGGDWHVPHGDLTAARAVRRLCEDRGLVVSAYGSYLRAGVSEAATPSSLAVLDTAAELGTGIVRVWAGKVASAAAGERDRAAVADSLTQLCDLARQRKLIVATEFHADTLTDDVDSCLRLLAAVDRANLRTFWQPPNGMNAADALATLRRVGPHLANLHVFHWWPDHQHRHPLEQGADRWLAYLHEAGVQSASDAITRYVSLEFICGDSVDQFRQDAATLRRWLEIVEQG